MPPKALFTFSRVPGQTDLLSSMDLAYLNKLTDDEKYEVIVNGYVDGCRILVPEWYADRRGRPVKSPAFHYEIEAEALAETHEGLRVHPRMAVRAPRSSAKSTSFTKAKTLWQAIVSTEVDSIEEYNVISSASKGPAWNWFRSIVNALLGSLQVKRYFGQFKKGSYWRFGDGDVEIISPSGRKYRLRCAGAGQDARGDQGDAVRPTGYTLDDITRDEESRSDAGRASKVDWVLATVDPALDPDGWLHNIGTPRPYEDDWNSGVIEKLAESGEWFLMTYKAIEDFHNPHSKLLWPERLSYEMLLSRYNSYKAAGREYLFWSEYMCERRTKGLKSFRREWWENNRWSGECLYTPAGPYLVIDGYGTVPVNVFVGMDPAFSQTRRSDRTVISAWGMTPRTHPVFPGHYFQIDQISSRDLDSKSAMQEFVLMGARYRARRATNERVAAQVTLTEWALDWQRELIESGELDHIFEITDYPPGNRQTKDARLIGFWQTPYALGKVHHKVGICEELEEELDLFPSMHPDCMDSGYYACVEAYPPSHICPDVGGQEKDSSPSGRRGQRDWLVGAYSAKRHR